MVTGVELFAENRTCAAAFAPRGTRRGQSNKRGEMT